MSRFKISVIVPIYNNIKYLKRCIDSIINQTYSNLEIILINDGSTDGSAQICDHYKEIDRRVIVIHTNNEGVAKARNKGLKTASGDFITFVDSDDFIDRKMYEILLKNIIDEKADIVQCGYYRTDESGNIILARRLKEEIVEGRYENSYFYARGDNTTNYVVNKLYRKDIIDNLFFPETVVSEDFVFNVKAYYNSERTMVISEPLYFYVDNKSSVTNKEFNVGKLDAIKNGIRMYEFHNRRFDNLCPFFALYIVNYSMNYYRSVNTTNVNNKKELLNYLRKTFYIYLLKLNKKTIWKKKRNAIHVIIFLISPKLYSYIYKLFKE